MTPEPIHRETAKHRAAFETYYGSDRDVLKVAESCRISERTARNWVDWFGWRAKADARDAEVEMRATRAAIKRKTEMLERHRKSGELAHRRGTEFFARNAITDERAALSALKIGSEMERTAEGLPAWMVAMMGLDDDALAAYIATATGAIAAGDSAADGAGTGPADLDSGNEQAE
jgi:hypothetical protein